MKLTPSVLVRELFGSAGGVQVRRWRRRFIVEPRQRRTPPIAWPAAWLRGWPFRYQLTIAPGKVASDLSDFALLIDNDTPGLADHARADGHDFRVTRADALTTVPLDREAYTVAAGTGHLTLWTVLDSLPTATPTILYLYLGKGDASDASRNPNPWPASHRLVLHGSDPPADASTYSHPITNVGTTDAQGTIARARLGLEQYMTAPHHASLDITGPLSLSAWFTRTVATPSRTLIGKRPATPNNAYELAVSYGSLHYHYGLSSVSHDFGAMPLDDWFQFVSAADASGADLFRNGILGNSWFTDHTPDPGTTNLGLGARPAGAWAMRGKLDETRIIAARLTPHHVAADFATQSAPLDFLSWSDLQSAF